MSQEKGNKIQQAQMQSTEGELSDEQLEAVAGGTDEQMTVVDEASLLSPWGGGLGPQLSSDSGSKQTKKNRS